MFTQSMRELSGIRLLIYSIVAFGCVLAFAAAIVPHYHAGHKLAFSVLCAGALPYLLYGLLTEVYPSRVLIIGGLLVLSVDAVVKLIERFVSYDQYASGVIFYMPIVASCIILMLAFTARQKP